MKITGKGLIPLPVSFITVKSNVHASMPAWLVARRNEDILQETDKHIE